MTTSTTKEFAIDQEQYDQNTYWGRFRKMLDVVDPRTLLCSQQEIQEALDLLAMHSSSKVEVLDHEALWRAKKIRDAAVHPDTKEIIPHPFRMSGFLPFNAPICVGALMATSTPSILFWHWANQTHNASINYFNRNASQPIDTSTLVQGYLGAVTGAISVAMGLKTLIAKSVADPRKAATFQRFVALPAIMTAAAINVILMRRGELETGIDVYDEDGNVVGTSRNAAEKALIEMTLSRMALPIPVFAFPPIGATIIESLTRATRNRPRMSFVINTSLLFIGFGFGLPATIAIFPQIGTISLEQLESEFQSLPPQLFRYNKGL